MNLPAFIRPAPLFLAVGPAGVTVRPVLADEWLIALSSDAWAGAVVPGLLDPGDVSEVAVMLAAGRVTAEQIIDAAREAVEGASGRRWWEALRLVAYAGHPANYGHLVLEGVDPTRLTFAAWCAAWHTILTRNLEEKDRFKFDFEFETPPAGLEEQIEDWDSGIPEGFSAALPPGTA